MDNEKIAKFIYNLRKKNKLTQKEFAKKLNVTAQAVSKWENARGIPDIEILKKISEVFDVDIDSIIDGKKKTNKKFILVTIIFIIIIGILIGININSSDYEYTSLKSDTNDWKVKGVAVYSKDKNSIYISDIEYLDKEFNKEKYTVVECVLYENNKDVDKKISQCGKIKNNKNYSNNDVKSLKYLLKDIEFNVDGYKSSCKNLSKSNLFIDINLMTKENKKVTYKVPIKLNSKCN